MVQLKHHMTCRINKEIDVQKAVMSAKELAKMVGFSASEQTMIATAASELARNILAHAQTGIIELRHLQLGIDKGVCIIAEDEGPGISDIEQAFEDRFSTGGTLGVGLPGVRRIMDELSIDTSANHGTRIIATKWIS